MSPELNFPARSNKGGDVEDTLNKLDPDRKRVTVFVGRNYWSSPHYIHVYEIDGEPVVVQGESSHGHKISFGEKLSEKLKGVNNQVESAKS